MAESESNRSTWDRVQMAVTLLTALVGVWLSISQATIQRHQDLLKSSQDSMSISMDQLKLEHSTIESLSSYFDLMTGADSGKAKMGAYAIYMLEKHDPEMVVSLVLASGRPALRDVLLDLGRRDQAIHRQLDRIFAPPVTSVETPDESPAPSDAVADAGSLLAQIVSTGWFYVGVYREDRWSHGPMLEGLQQLPVAGTTYVVRRRLYLRAAPPDTANRHSGPIQGVLDVGSRVAVLEVRPTLGGDHVWVRVSVLGSGERGGKHG
jgi:hypothetical protein